MLGVLGLVTRRVLDMLLFILVPTFQLKHEQSALFFQSLFDL